MNACMNERMVPTQPPADHPWPWWVGTCPPVASQELALLREFPPWQAPGRRSRWRRRSPRPRPQPRRRPRKLPRQRRRRNCRIGPRRPTLVPRHLRPGLRNGHRQRERVGIAARRAPDPGPRHGGRKRRLRRLLDAGVGVARVPGRLAVTPDPFDAGGHLDGEASPYQAE